MVYGRHRWRPIRLFARSSLIGNIDNGHDDGVDMILGNRTVPISISIHHELHVHRRFQTVQ